MTDGILPYDDLQVRVDRDADGSYRVLATAPDGRTGRGSFQAPITDEELDDFVQDVGLAPRRGAEDNRIDTIKEFGAKLFDTLFKEQVGSVFSTARETAFERGHGLRISLRLSGAPELMRIPWEFLYHRPRFISQSVETPLVRTLDINSSRRPLPVRLPLRILGIVSSPVGYAGLDADDEREKLEKALSKLQSDGSVELMWLERATLDELRRRVAERDEIHVIHYIGHGAYDERTEAGNVVLETPQGRADDVSGEELGAMLQDERSLRLVVLNSCEGARTSRIDPFSGVATSLISFDIPAVIGMQFEITDVAAIAFSGDLYSGLSQGLPIDAAVAPARRAIATKRQAEFGTPVVYLRSGETRLFDIAESPVDAVAFTPEAGREVASTRPGIDSMGDAHPQTQQLMSVAGYPSSPRTQDHTSPTSPPGWSGASPPGWSGDASYLKVTGSRGVTTLRLKLDEEHEIVYSATPWKDILTVDGRNVSPGSRNTTLFTLLDAGKERTSILVTSQSSSFSVWAPRIKSLVVDGVSIPLKQGELQSIDTPLASNGWAATASYRTISKTHGVTRLSLRLNQPHEIVFNRSLSGLKLTVDGHQAKTSSWGSKEKVTLTDGEVERTCVIITDWPGRGWPFYVDRIVSCEVDGQMLPLEQGALQ